jgi:hypothetical protein
VKELPAPPSITAAQAGSDQTRIRVDWSAVAGAAAYSVERCIGSTCTNFTVIQCVTTNAFIHGPLTPPVTARYRIRASRATGCSATTAGNLGAYSALATGELTLASNGRVLTWIAPTTNTDGSALTNLRASASTTARHKAPCHKRSNCPTQRCAGTRYRRLLPRGRTTLR